MSAVSQTTDHGAGSAYRLCVAPMMDWTDRHCRTFHRLLAPAARLYTEMVTTGAVLHGDRQRLLQFNQEEHPLALQLGGSDPAELAECARIACQWNYDEINLNVGCPSDRVQRGRFGACLMLEPGLVKECVSTMREAVDLEITVKTRIGVDDCDSYAYFSDFIHCVAESGCNVFIIHARKAWLSGLSPKQNREIPELRHHWVYQLKQERPDLTLVLNGGVMTAGDAQRHMQKLDGVMLGRAAYLNPWVLAECQRELFGYAGVPDRKTAVSEMTDYLRSQARSGIPVKTISRHLLGLFQGLPGARRWRRFISERAHLDDDNGQLLLQAMAAMQHDGSEPGRHVA